jgi:hypothetical protein
MNNTLDTDGSAAAQDLIPSISIEALLRRRDAAVERALQAVALLQEGQAIAREGGFGFLDIALMRGYGSTVEHRLCGNVVDDRDTEPLIRRQIDRGAWAMLMHESGLRSVMNAETRTRWDEQLAGKDVPPLTRENIAATFAQLHAQRGQMLEDGVIAVFRSLSWNYKTNHPAFIGHRVILTYLTHYRYKGARFGSVNHRVTNQLDDLQRVICLVNGQPEPDHRTGWYARVSEATRGMGIAENETMQVRLFANGNGHVTFKDQAVVDRLNAIIARRYPGALPAPRSSRRHC